MAILIDKNTKYLVQGITGKEGTRALKWMLKSGANVLAGVTPGKGGQEVEGIPVFNSIKEALAKFNSINATSIYTPAKFVFSAAKEAIEADIPLIHIFAEGVPTKDITILLEMIRDKNKDIRILGPSSIGVISPNQSMIGSMGGGNINQFLAPYSSKVLVNKNKGGVVVMSKSGGMANTIASMLTRAGIAQSSVIGLGGDRFIGTTYADLLIDLENDDDTWGLVIIGEIGGSYEEDFAKKIIELGSSKKIVAFVSGIFAQKLPQGVSFGHAGAIVDKTVGTREGKIAILKEAGVSIAETPQEIINLLKKG